MDEERAGWGLGGGWARMTDEARWTNERSAQNRRDGGDTGGLKAGREDKKVTAGIKHKE